jgi:YgiT-type zinc finger domain-containing protein
MVGGLQNEDEDMNCIHCQGEMKRQAAPLHIDRKSCHVTLDAVPAWVCEQCGEAYFEEKEVDAIQDLLKSVDQKSAALRPAG